MKKGNKWGEAKGEGLSKEDGEEVMGRQRNIFRSFVKLQTPYVQNS